MTTKTKKSKKTQKTQRTRKNPVPRALRTRAVAAAVGGTVLLGGAALISPTPAGAATGSGGTVTPRSCHSSAKSYSKPSGYYLPEAGTYLTTTSNCAGVSIEPHTNRYVKVCFKPTSGLETCQDSYTLAKANTWTVLSASVKDGTSISYEFRSSAKSTGHVAY